MTTTAKQHQRKIELQRQRRAADPSFRERNAAASREYRSSHAVDREKEQERHRRWRTGNEEHKAKQLTNQRKWYHRTKNDPQTWIKRNLRSRMAKAVSGNFKTGSAVRDLGCTIPELRDYLAVQFQPGMSWGNYGSWHVDHIIPLAAFDLADRKQFLKAAHFTNLQPLWAADNYSKGARYNGTRSN